THPEFGKHSCATAATKAEGRSLRKALQLKRVYAAEEMEDTTVTQGPQKITAGQNNFLNMMCERNNVSVMKLVNLSKTEQYPKVE
ncbi:hypothetical protein, partial [Enterococcus faecium]|uniref:hypothetical protein n=1 Tax=Enterococcus faecium TaxID=1352 RepID=UPI003DA0697F